MSERSAGPARGAVLGVCVGALWTGGRVFYEHTRGRDLFGRAPLELDPGRPLSVWAVEFVGIALVAGLVFMWIGSRRGSDTPTRGRAGLGLAFVLLLTGLAALAFVGRRAQDAAASRPPHVVLVSLDTLRADHLGCYGYERETSPYLDGLAVRGVRFADVTSQATATLSSHLSMLTSLYPPQIAITRDDGENFGQQVTTLRLAERVVTLAETMGARGYATAAFTGGTLVAPRYGFAQGFDHFQEGQRLAEAGLDASLSWLETWLEAREDDRPLFLFVHSYGPHDP